MTSKPYEEDILYELNAISVEKAFNSDNGSDSDAEVEHISSVPTIALIKLNLIKVLDVFDN